MPRKALLASGVLASLLYVATDILGGLSYPGYSFSSQMISELGAVGAPSKRLVDVLFLFYSVLVLTFGAAIVREAGRNTALRLTGGALILYAGMGLVSGLFPMHARGTVGLTTDIPHIIATIALVTLLLLTIGSGAFTFGPRFRTYSLVTLGVILLFGGLTARFVNRIAAGDPTPGAGIIERIDVYAPMLWLAVLSIMLLRRPAPPRATRASRPAIDGMIAPGFEEVRAEFERNFAERREIGAAVSAYWHGEKVIDLWGGRRAPAGGEPWTRDTMVIVNSVTKGMSALTLAVANARGWLAYDAPVSRYWPEFAANGKGTITVRQLLGHEAGLVLLDEQMSREKLSDLDYLARVLARQRPAWTPGTRHGYHTITIGLYMQELMRRVDPAHRTLGSVFHDEIAEPLGLDFYIGLPRDVAAERLASLKPLSIGRGLLALRYTPFATTRKMIQPGSLLRRSFVGVAPDWTDRRWMELELPAGNGIGTARALARAYSVLAEGGAEVGIMPATFRRITAPPVVADPTDTVLGVPSYFSLGFLRPGPDVAFGSTPRALGAPGAGGSFAFADPDAHIGYAYVMNRLDFYLTDDPRELALRAAIYRAIARRNTERHESPGDRPRANHPAGSGSDHATTPSDSRNRSGTPPAGAAACQPLDKRQLNMSDQRWARGLIVGGLILLVLALVDPLEGSLITVPGVSAVTVGAFLTHSRLRVQACWGAAVLVLGVSAMWIMSALGGIGGDTGRSMWWAVLLVPYPVGWLLGLVTGIRLLREVFRPAARA